MSNDRYLEVLNCNIKAVQAGESPDELMPLLQWLKHYRPYDREEDPNCDYYTSADIQAELAEIVTLELNAISTIMWRLGYEISVDLTHPAWVMTFAD